ncbi:HaaA family cyclophane-containing RiPP peptide [Streptomyces sp. NBC_01716]|uniref:HaaA family cyclophane-containing RiPP peptide n=1 Tax=Streptomyces sp. NBC_01716 TaxID=2975917 RepID=UPI002E33CCDF|nr:HaaA family cyclophane-containing RiPP peptide [Streptomyces sp. NBC_01716]
MLSNTSLTAPHATSPVGIQPTEGSAVLDRIAVRVRQRLAAEQAATTQTGDGGHAASLIWPRPL